MDLKEKELLLKDLSARLLYGLKLRYVEDLVVKKESHVITLNNIYLEHILNGDADIKPYLRPMSSMTEEEKEELKKLFDAKEVTNDSLGFNEGGTLEDYVSQISYTFCGGVIDWLLAHHFDFRGLIEKNLALEAPEGIYN